jgi:CHAT domain-containing protein
MHPGSRRPRKLSVSRPLRILVLLLAIVGNRHPRLALAASQTQTTRSDSAATATPDAIREMLRKGNYREAEEAARKLLSGLESASPVNRVEQANALDLLVESLWRGGKARSEETLAMARRAMAAADEAYPKDDVRRSVSRIYMGNILVDTRDFDGARAALDEALALREQALGTDSVEVAAVLMVVGKMHEARRELSEARVAWSRAVTIQEKALGPEDAQLAGGLANLARIAYLGHDLATAKILMERALAIRVKQLGPDHPDTARTKANFCNILIELGDYPRAETLAREAAASVEKILGPDHPQLATSLEQLTHVMYLNGKSEEAIPIQRRALAISEKSYGSEAPKVGFAVNNLGLLLQAMGRGAEAREHLERGLRIQDATSGPNSQESAEDHASIAALLELMGLRQEARAQAEKSLEIFTASAGPDSPPTTRPYNTLARLAWAEGDYASALDHALRESRILVAQFDATGSILTEHEAMQYEASLRRGLDTTLSILAYDAWDKSVARDPDKVWSAVSRARALVLNQLASRHRDLAAHASPENRSLVAAFQKARDALATLLIQGPGASGSDDYPKKLAAARAQREAAERSLAEKSSIYRAMMAERDRELKDILAALPPATALVSYVLFDRVSSPPPPGDGKTLATVTSTPSYLAFAYAPGRGVHWQRLGSAASLEGLVAAWRDATTVAPRAFATSGAQQEAESRRTGEALRRKVWDPLKPFLGDVKQVFIVPDGALHLVNFSALPSGSSQYLLEKGPLLHYLSAERDAASSPAENDASLHALVIGGVDFDRLSEETEASCIPQPPTAASAVASNRPEAGAFRSAPSSCEHFHQVRFSPLPGSRDEAESIAKLLEDERSSQPDAVKLITGAQADETLFKSRAPSSTLLHLATHGFFYEGDCASGLSDAHRNARLSRGRGQDPMPVVGESPLLLSGLALAGSNRRLSANPCSSADDGLLTAEEIASLDLSSVRWVVLSSCDTGLGLIQAGEGVLGLRRAFHEAGARTLIMSLWKVDDQATREWMTRLYQARLSGRSTAASMRQASLDLIQTRRSKGKSTHPFYWGAFVAAGDWR